MIAGIDFGTTNSVICLIGEDGTPRPIRFSFEDSEYDVFRTVLNFWQEQQGQSRRLASAAGPEAVQTYLDDALSCRLIMSMKTYLSQRSFTQTRIFGRDFRLEDLIARFLTAMFRAAGVELAGLRRIVAGRPVKFAGETADDALGVTRLRQAFALAGAPEVEIAFEPEGAGYRFIRTLNDAATVLVGDFGGGTSDFSLLRFQPGARGSIEQLGHTGIGIAGDTFDRRIMDHVVCPMLGRDDTYAMMGNEMPIPIGLYNGLAQWHRLSLMRTPRVLNDIAEIARTASHPERLKALERIVRDEAGYDLYRAVSTTKATLSEAPSATLSFDHPGLHISQEVRRDAFEDWIAADLRAMGAAVDRLLETARIGSDAVDHVFLTGGTSLVPAVRRLFADRFGEHRLRGGEEFISVAEGLALIGLDGLKAPADRTRSGAAVQAL